MSRRGMLLALVVLAVASTGAFADHVLHFTNGTSMPVRTYRIADDMIYVDLGGNAFMAFPEAQVESIENPNRSFGFKPSTAQSRQKGRMVASSGRNNRRVTSQKELKPASSTAHQAPNRYNAGAQRTPTASDQRYSGGAVGLADPGRMNGANSVGSDGGLRGAQRVGNRNVLPGQYQSNRPRAVNIQMRDTGFIPPAGFNPPDTGTGNTGAGGSGDTGASGDGS